jgi:hypothetical protein
MTIAPFPVPPIVKSVTVCARRRGRSRCLRSVSRAGGHCRGSTPAPTRWTVQSSRASAGASSNARPMGAKPCGEPCWRMTRRIAWPFPGSSSWRPSRLEIRFTAEDSGTRVELTHSGWEKLGDAAASQRERYDRGWGTVFERHFVEYVNSSAR